MDGAFFNVLVQGGRRILSAFGDFGMGGTAPEVSPGLSGNGFKIGNVD
jgi:hypothetical protein